MKPPYGLVTVFLSAAILAACSGGNSTFASSVPPPGVAADSQPRLAYGAVSPDRVLGRFAYVPNNGSSNVSAYSIDASGVMTQVAGSPFAAGYGPEGVAVDPAGKFAYVTNAADDTISAYMINAKSGVLTQVVGSPFGGAGSAPDSMAVDPTGKFAYVASYGYYATGSVSAYKINSSSGALTQVSGSPFAAGTGPDGVAVDPTGKFTYVVNHGSDSVSAYKISATSGQLTQVSGSPFEAGTGPDGVTVDPTGKFAYVANVDPGGYQGVSAFTINAKSGALKPVKGSPFAAGQDPTAVAVDPNGKFAYVAANQGVYAFTINAKSGALKPVKGSPFGTGSGSDPNGVAVDPKGKFAYVADFESDNVSVFTIDATNGALTSQGTYGAGTFPFNIAATNPK